MEIFDVAVVGAGHNALVSACYLAKAGKKVVVLERRPVIGGAVCTEEMFGGYKVDIGSSIHVLLPQSGIVEELGLDKHGLEYIELDPFAFYPVRGSDKAITFYRSLDKTCESIAAICPQDAETYRNLILKSADVLRLIMKAMEVPPNQALFEIIKTCIKQPQSLRRTIKAKDVIRHNMTSSLRMVEELFISEEVKAALVWLGAQHGPQPDAATSGAMICAYGSLHEMGVYRPIGGSGMATVAMGRVFEAHGGTIITSAAVDHVSKAIGGGACFEVKAGDTIVQTKNVLFGCHVRTAMLKMLDKSLLSDDIERKLKATKISNASGFMVRQAVSELPQYAGQKVDARGIGECHSGMQLLCPTVDTLVSTMHRNRVGELATYPPVMQMTFTAVDPSLAPEGKHLLYSWSSYPPYHLANGHWDDIADREADRIWDVVCEYSPNMKGKLIDRYVQSPLEIERVLGMLQGDVCHLDMGMDQMMSNRPIPEMGNYKTHVDGIYLTGSSTHPGGAVWGASGRSAAKVMLKEM